MDITDVRREYTQRGLRREDLDTDPILQLRRWLEQACQTDLVEPNSMALATASLSGRPTVRNVLLKGLDQRGLVFFTNYESTKAQDIAENPQVALLFSWLQLERQVEVLGTAEKISHAESLRYFVSRPFGSRLGAWVSQQSRVITSRSLLELKWQEMRKKFADGDVPLPSFWGGYRVRPDLFEFWQGRPNRLHDRFQYGRQKDDTWLIERLAP